MQVDRIMEILSKERDPKAANKALSAVRIPFPPVIHSFLSPTLRPPSSAPCAILARRRSGAVRSGRNRAASAPLRVATGRARPAKDAARGGSWAQG